MHVAFYQMLSCYLGRIAYAFCLKVANIINYSNKIYTFKTSLHFCLTYSILMYFSLSMLLNMMCYIIFRVFASGFINDISLVYFVCVFVCATTARFCATIWQILQKELKYFCCCCCFNHFVGSDSLAS